MVFSRSIRSPIGAERPCSTSWSAMTCR
jgi:hypothetical protein